MLPVVVQEEESAAVREVLVVEIGSISNRCIISQSNDTCRILLSVFLCYFRIIRTCGADRRAGRKGMGDCRGKDQDLPSEQKKVTYKKITYHHRGAIITTKVC